MIITKEILLKAGFKCFEEDSNNTSYYSYSPDEGDWNVNLTYSKNNGRDWHCEVNTSPTTYADADIQTIEHFNKLMDLMDINFKLNDRNK